MGAARRPRRPPGASECARGLGNGCASRRLKFETRRFLRRRMAVRGPRINVRFFQDTWSELKKVVWPSRKQATNLTMIVIAVSAAVGVILGAIDYVFYLVFQQLVLQAGRGI